VALVTVNHRGVNRRASLRQVIPAFRYTTQTSVMRPCATISAHNPAMNSHGSIEAQTNAALAFMRTPFLIVLAVGCLAALPVFAQTPQQNRSRTFGTDACGPADPAYIHTANETGGVPLFLQRSEAGKAMHLVRDSMGNNKATMFWATGTLQGKPLAIEIPVDSVIPRITFTFSVDTKGSQLKLTQPSGGVVTQGLASTEVTELNCGRILTVSSPEPGVWRAEVTGSGQYWLQAEAQSDIHFISVEFVEQGGRPGHEGMFKIAGQPVRGTPANLEAHVSAEETKTLDFTFVSEHGDIIQKLQMHPINTDRSFYELAGKLDLPNVPFRVAMSGLDKNDKPYQRFFSHLFHAESVEVSADRGEQELAPGSTKQIIFRVRNIGGARTFKVTVADARKFVSNVEPKELAIGANESATVRMDVAIPAATASGLGDDVVVVTKSVEEKPTSNSAIIHLLVTASTNTGHNPH
jgi:hypothetical protein